MLHHIRDQKRHGQLLPRSKVVEQRRGKAQERTFVSRLSVVKHIDLFKDPLPDSALRGIKKIKEIIFAGRCVVVVTEGGVCRAYDTQTTRLLSDLNPANPWRKVTTAVYHSINDTIVIVFEPNPGGLQCHVFVASALEQGQLRCPAIATDFANVILSHPAFFEFDEANGVILAAQQGDVQSFQFWNHTKFKLVFAVHGEDFEEVRLSHGLAALFKPTNAKCFSATVFDVEDGRRVAEISIPIDQHRRVEFLELLVSKVLFKQDRASLRVIDLLADGASTKVQHTRDSFSPVGFVFFEAPERVMGKKYLDQRARRFFTISKDTVQFWILQTNRLDTLHSIQIHGLREAGLCQQCMDMNLLAVCPSHASCNKDETLAPCGPGLSFVSALDLHESKRSADTPKSRASPDSASNRFKEPTKRGLRSLGTGRLLFFSIEDGQYVGSVPSRLCGDVEVLQLSAENTTVGCGDHAGVVRLLQASRINPEADLLDHKGAACEIASRHPTVAADATLPREQLPSSYSQAPMPGALPEHGTIPSDDKYTQLFKRQPMELQEGAPNLETPLAQDTRDDIHRRSKRSLFADCDQEAEGRKRTSRLLL